MIQLVRINGSELWLNPIQIESIEQTPDTVITLSNGHKYLVRQSAAELAELMQVFWQRIGHAGVPSASASDYVSLADNPAPLRQEENRG
jgi:flagellar protein FlbD